MYSVILENKYGLWNATALLRKESKDKLHEWLGDYDESLTNGVDKIQQQGQLS